ncbi:hypothetical protein MPTK1_6g13360 [Marchantia polymorpha subsp. ruderalis]|uniref:Uncharacterized protein n=2 Tax=Marchantia polymorpha TaxID=3197 RepID=A0AAF6BRM3_MARPO|nr:hypothetical protein MARPO_0059s0014 [Marchantia polymorpha]BBN14657.1 hypothetical protein Mp_6g13360 [Marchantia polymorpha subsp. ruderalis]|eukprot:PTQ37062.1 hypothetical protein MARPO_0059s0014 [Marchantia polymorpha]
MMSSPPSILKIGGYKRHAPYKSSALPGSLEDITRVLKKEKKILDKKIATVVQRAIEICLSIEEHSFESTYRSEVTGGRKASEIGIQSMNHGRKPPSCYGRE